MLILRMNETSLRQERQPRAAYKVTFDYADGILFLRDNI